MLDGDMYETLVFEVKKGRVDLSELSCDRYYNVIDASIGHVAKWSDPVERAQALKIADQPGEKYHEYNA